MLLCALHVHTHTGGWVGELKDKCDLILFFNGGSWALIYGVSFVFAKFLNCDVYLPACS